MKSMKFRRPTTRLRRALAVAAIATLATGTAATLTATPAAAATGTLTAVSLTVSNNAANVKGTGNTATYTWAFTTATGIAAGTPLTQITLTVPTSTAGTSLTPLTYGLPCTGATAAMVASSGVVTVSLSGCTDVAASTAAVVAISGFTNPTAAGAFTTGTVTTQTGTSPTFTDVDTGDVPSTSFNDNTTGVTVYVPESLTFATDTASISLAPIPGSGPVAAPAVNLTVATNAANGYKLSGCVTSAIKNVNSSDTIAQASPTADPSNLGTTTSAFGATVTANGSAAAGHVGTPAIGATGWSSTAGSYAGYSSGCTTTGHDVIASDSGPATLDTIALTNAASVKSTQVGGTYSGTITYVVTPSY